MKEGGGGEGEREKECALGLLRVTARRVTARSSALTRVSTVLLDNSALLRLFEDSLRAYRVSGRAEQRPQYAHHPIMRITPKPRITH